MRSQQLCNQQQCNYQQSNGTVAAKAGASELPLIVGVHVVGSANFSFAKHLVGRVWRSVCDVCGLRCATPSMAAEPNLPIPATTELAVVPYSRSQLPDLDGVAHERAGAPRASALAAVPSRFLHFVLDLGAQLRATVPPSLPLGAPPREASAPALVHHPGVAATRMLLRASNRTVLSIPPISTVCQDRATWRSAFRFAGIRNDALPDIWRRLSRDLPALFRCDRELEIGGDRGARRAVRR